MRSTISSRFEMGRKHEPLFKACYSSLYKEIDNMKTPKRGKKLRPYIRMRMSITFQIHEQ